MANNTTYIEPETIQRRSNWFGMNPRKAIAQGMPSPSSDQYYSPPLPQPRANGVHYRDRAPQFTVPVDGREAYNAWLNLLPSNPRGAAVLPLRPPQPFSYVTGAYTRSAIFFKPQSINYGIQPEPGGPLWPPGILAAMMGNYQQAAAFTPQQAWGFGNPNARFRTPQRSIY